MIDAQLIGQWAEPISVAVGAIAVGWAVRSHRKQLEAQLFLTLTQRYEEIMCGFPDDAFVVRCASDHTLPRESPELSIAVLRYLNLSSEEYYLWKRGYLPKRLWKIWSGELVRMVRTPLIIREWQKLRDEFSSYPEFQVFIERSQNVEQMSSPPKVAT